MGYVDNSPYFFMAMEMVADLANEDISKMEQASNHLLEMAGKYRSSYDSGTPEAQADAIWGSRTIL